MRKYLLIESRDPFESADTEFVANLARELATAGNDITVFLVQNGVFPARQGARASALAGLVNVGVKVLADEFSLRERGISPGRLKEGVQPAPLSVVVDYLAAGSRALWH